MIPATGVIGLLLPNFENPIFPELAQAIEKQAPQIGLRLDPLHHQSAAFREVDYVHMLLDRQVDGMIFISCEMTNMSGEHDHYGRLVDEGARMVFVNGALNSLNVPSVAVDEVRRRVRNTASARARAHAHRLRRRAGALSPDAGKGGRAGAGPAGRGLDSDGLVAHDEFDVEGGARAARKLLARRRAA